MSLIGGTTGAMFLERLAQRRLWAADQEELHKSLEASGKI